MENTGFSWSEGGEWLLTNGLGGYASSTLTGLNTRKYHGLLVAAFSPDDRRVLVSKLDEEIVAGGKTYKLSTNQYWDTVAPQGFEFMKSFSLDPFPTFTYQVPGATLKKTVFMPHGLNAVVVEYDIKGDAAFSANLLATSRDHHWVLREPRWHFEFEKIGKLVSLKPTHEKPPVICVSSTKGRLVEPPYEDRLVKGLFYRTELERGYPRLDDVYIAARLDVEQGKDNHFFVVCSSDFSKAKAAETCRKILKSPMRFKEEEVKLRRELVERFYKKGDHKRSESLTRIVESSDDFIIKKGGLTEVTAGYPWFGEWGRDSLISLPGLCLVTGRKKDAEAVMLNLLKHSRNGIIPNHFMGEKSFDSVDTPLWLFWTVWKYLEHTRDYTFVRKHLWAEMKRTIVAYNKWLDADGLIKTESEKPVTWMDAVVNGSPVTPRNGKAVEIQALWFNALQVCSELAKRFKENPQKYLNMASACRVSFNQKFWNGENGYLFDVVSETKDASVRPNALFSISLPFPVLEKDKWKRIVGVAQKELLTPYGLRTLSPHDLNYKGSASGNQAERDLAYHNGDAWPWLFGAFVDAYKKAYPHKPVDEFLRPILEDHLKAGGVGCVSEIFDGSPPYRPEGCIHQAWSVGEVLRVLAENQTRT